MKKIIYFGLLISLIFLSCKESVIQNPTQNGSLFIDSEPQGAKIFLQGTFTNQYTPATINNLVPDNYDIRVEVESGIDSAFIMDVKSNITTSATIDFENKMGRCYFQSNPSGAEIFLDDVKTNLQTPSFINYLKTGKHNYKLQLGNDVFEDSFYVSSRQTIYVNYNFIPPVTLTGSIFLNSSPPGAQIWVSGLHTGKVTPDSIVGLVPNDYTVTLKLSGYRDTTFIITVVANYQTTKQVTLVSTLSTTMYGPVRIYETAGTTTSQPSGLDLSSGIAYGMSSSGNDKIDIYYSTSGTSGTPYLVQSADLYPNLTRHTVFSVGNGTDITDGTDSPIYPLSGWTDHMGDRETNYVYLYDTDGHYSKIKITNFHSGSGQGDPSWVEVTWIYNNTGADNRF